MPAPDLRPTMQSNVRQRALTIAGGIAGVSTLAVLATSAVLPLAGVALPPTIAWLSGLGANALAAWLESWARHQTAQAIGQTDDLAQITALATALDQQLKTNQPLAEDLATLLQQGDLLAVALDGLQGQAEQQTRLLRMLTEDLQQTTVRNERLHEATYQEVQRQSQQLQVAFTGMSAKITSMLQQVMTLLGRVPPTIQITNQASNQGFQGVANAPVTINQHAAPRTPAPPAFQVPYPRALLIGRETELAELATLLTGDAPVALTPAIAGMGGVGKTMLAAAFARQYQSAFPGGVFWLNMEQPENIADQVAACAGPTGLDLDGYADLSFAERIQRTQVAWNGPQRRLLVFDNLENPALLKRWQPTGNGCRVLITTRRDDWPRLVRRLRLTILPRPQSIELLLGARAEEQCRSVAEVVQDQTIATEANTICGLLGDLPLALAIAGAYLKLSPSTTLTAYRTRIATNPLSDEQRASAIIAEVLAEAGLPTGRERGIIATFAISYQQLNPDAPSDTLALMMLHAAAYCAAAPIPQAVLWEIGAVAGDEIDVVEQRDQAIRRLRATGLLTLDAEGDPPPVVLHRLIAAYVRSLLTGDDHQRTLIAALTVAANSAINSGYPRQSAPLLPHLLHIEALPRSADDAAIGDLIGALARVQEQQVNYAAAEPLFLRALAIAEQALGPSHPTTSSRLNNLAGLYASQGRYAAAEPLLLRALAIAEQALGPSHPNTGTRLNNLAGLYESQGRYGDAEPLLLRALAIAEQALGPSHPTTSSRLNNLAALYYAQGRYPEAEPLLLRALAVAEQALGPSHPATGTRLNNLANLYEAQGRYGEAEPLYLRTLAIAEQTQGPSHPATGTSLNNLAFLYQAQGRYPEAEPLYLRALAIAEQHLGADHPTTGTSLNNLANLYEAQGRYGEAEPLYLRTLAIAEQTQGPSHPATGTSLNNLAFLYQAQGRYPEAEPLYLRALAIAEQHLGADHPTTGTSLNNLAFLYQAQGRYTEAEPLYVRALAIAEQAQGPSHPETGTSLNNLAYLYRAQGRYGEAEQLYVRALAIAEQAQGPSHPATGTRLNNLAGLYRAQGRYGEAEQLYVRALAIAEQTQGPSHPETGTRLWWMGVIYLDRGDSANARPYLERALAIFQARLGVDHPDTLGVQNYLNTLDDRT